MIQRTIALAAIVGLVLGTFLVPLPAQRAVLADNTYQTLPFSQAWTNTNLITANDDWSGVPGIIGYRGDDLTTSTGTDPQTILVDGLSTPIDVNANRSDPDTFTTGGVTEFDGISNPVVALSGSGTADAPFILINLTTTDLKNITVAYNIRDIDGSTDNAAQQVALHYRVGASGDFTNLPAGYIADATTGPSLATLVTPVAVTLPAAANNQPQVQLRIMTTNAVGNDEWVGIDDIVVTGTSSAIKPDLSLAKTGPITANAGDTITYTISLSNTGTATASSTRVTDTLPAEVSYSTYTATSGVTFTKVSDTQLVWDVGDVLTDTPAIAIQVQGVITANIFNGTVVTNTATAATASSESDTSNNTSAVGTTVSSSLLPDVEVYVQKTTPATVVFGGELITYTIVYGNDGTQTAMAVLTDTLPSGFTAADIAFDDSGLNAIDAVNTRSWTATLASGTRFTFTLALTEPTSIADNTRITNTIVIAAPGAGNNPANDLASASSTVRQIVPIATARASGVGWSGTVAGNVIVPPSIFDTGTFAIQDATGGIYVFKSSGIPSLALGDLVQVNGTLKPYFGLLEFDPTQTIVRIGPGSVPAPQAISTNPTLVGNTQGSLISVTGTLTWTLTPPAPDGVTNWTAYINDGSGLLPVYVDKDTRIDMRGYTSPTQATIIGFSGNNNGPQIMPRYQSDVIIPDVIPPVVNATEPANNAANVSPYLPLSATFNESLNPTTVSSATFTLTDANSGVTGSVSYASGTRTATFTPSSSLVAFTRYTATLTTGIQDEAGNSLAAPYVWSFTTGALDITPPTIVSHFPASEAISVPLNSNIVITFSEDLKPNTVIPANFTLTGPSGTIGWGGFAYDAATDRLTLTPIVLTAQTRYTLTVGNGVTDWAGNPLAATDWSFTTGSETPMHAYFGDLHNHSSYSDGSLTPTDAFARGKAAGFDFMALTDHSYAIDDTEWANTLNAVNAATIPDTFVAIRGAEYTQGAEGHINVYNTVRHPCRTNSDVGSMCDYTPNLEKGVTVDGFYNWLSITGTQALDSAGSLAQFNHPGWINFNDWAYHPEVSPTMRLEEVGNGNGTSYVFSEDEYIRSLDYGWKLAATNNADTHSPYWGTNTDHRTGVWLTGLTKADLLDGLRARRTFATEDKNYSLKMKANGAWMGSDIPNAGSLAFEITGFDPDAEGGVKVQLITFGGAIVTQTQFASSDFTWNPIVPVTPGEHYYYVKVTQADGDRIVSSPIWAHGSVDVSLTDLTIEPTIASIYNPSLITARVTNRMATTQTVTVTFQIPGSASQVMMTTAPACVTGPCIDGYASISWQPTVTGPVTITAMISGTPNGDNLEDNVRSTVMDVTDEHLPLVLIDAAHGNTNALGREMRMFVKDLSDHRYNVLKQLTPFTASILNTATVKLLVITAPETAYTSDELGAIANYAATGGSLWICGLADYTSKVAWASSVTNRLNPILDRIETRTNTQINMRLNDDEVIDGNSNNGYVFGVEPGSFPGANATSIGVNVEKISTWSLSSIRGRLVTQPITAGTPGVQIVVQGDLDQGYTPDFHHNGNHTNNTDSDLQSDAYIYNPTWAYPNYLTGQPTDAIPLPIAAVIQLPGNGGRIMLYGDSNDGFGTFAYTAGDGKQNELFNLETVMWLLGDPVKKSTIAQARAYDVVNQPNNLRKLVWIEGKVTAAYGEFFNVLYVQDATGGITIHAPAGDISATQYLRGAQVRVLGTIDQYQGDTEVEFFEAEQVQVITPTNSIDPAPLPLSTHAAALESNQGWLTQIAGIVVSKNGESIFVDDGSGPVRAFLDGYNGTWDDIQVLDQVAIRGMISEDGEGHRIRVRNHGMHQLIPDDVTILTPNLSGSSKTVNTTHVTAGDLLTYTLVISNSGNGSATFALTDTLDANVTLISAPGFTVNGSTLTVTGTLNALASQTFAITVQANAGYSGTLSNVAQFSGDGQTRSLTAPNVTVVLPPVLLPNFSGSGKTVNTAVITGNQPFTYTLVVSNSGAASGTFALTDTLNANLTLISAPGFTVNGSTLTAAGPLPALGSQTFVVVVRAAATFSGTLTNTAQLSGDGQTRPLSAPNVIHRPQYTAYLPLVKK